MSRGSLRRAAIGRWLATAVTYALIAVASFLGFGGLGLLTWIFLDAGPSWRAQVPPVAVLSAAGFATLGWLVTALNQRALSRKQHTLNLLMQMRHSDLYRTQVKTITDTAPAGLALTTRQFEILKSPSTIATDGERAFFRAVTYVLNYYEFVCAAVCVGDLDAELIRRTIRPHIVTCHDKFAAPFEPAESRTYEHLKRVADDWRTSAEAGARKEWKAPRADPDKPISKPWWDCLRLRV